MMNKQMTLLIKRALIQIPDCPITSSEQSGKCHIIYNIHVYIYIYIYTHIYSVQEILPTVVQQEDWLVGLVGQGLLTQPVNWRMYLCSPDVTVTDWCSCECEYEQCIHRYIYIYIYILLLLHHKYNKNWGPYYCQFWIYIIHYIIALAG